MAKLTGKEAELAAKIQALMLEYGYKSTRYFVSHDATTARFTINTDKVVKDADGKVVLFAKQKAEFKAYHEIVGLKEEWLGKYFRVHGAMYRLEGLDMSKPKNTCVVTDSRGKVRIAPDATVKAAFESEEARPDEYGVAGRHALGNVPEVG